MNTYSVKIIRIRNGKHVGWKTKRIYGTSERDALWNAFGLTPGEISQSLLERVEHVS